jgi:hypothetical protein
MAGPSAHASADRASRVAIGGTGEKPYHAKTQRRQGAKIVQKQQLGFLRALCGFAPLRERLVLTPGSLRGFNRPGWAISSGLNRCAAERSFSDESQSGERATKRMLKMQVAPNMLLKTNGRDTKIRGLANMLMKTNGLLFLPIC